MFSSQTNKQKKVEGKKKKKEKDDDVMVMMTLKGEILEDVSQYTHCVGSCLQHAGLVAMVQYIHHT